MAKEITFYNSVGERYGNDMAEVLPGNQQQGGEFYILNPNQRITADVIYTLRRLKEEKPYEDGDFKLVEVVPHRDYDVDYSHIIFSLAALFEDIDRRSPDGETVWVETHHAKLFADIGLLFGVYPSEVMPQLGIQRLETEEEQPQPSFEDEIEPYYIYTYRAPDLQQHDIPISVQSSSGDTLSEKNGSSKNRPPFIRGRIDPKVTQEMV